MSRTPPVISLRYENPLKKNIPEAFFADLPRSPGVYFMHGSRGELLYVGKAKDLRARVSSYRNAKPGAVADRILEMIEYVREIRWEGHSTEHKALLRESELLRAIQPPYNIAGTWEIDYLYLGIRFEPSKLDGQVKVHFKLTSHADEEHYRLFGCFKHRAKVKRGYTALLRLLHAGSSTRPRFSFPARIARTNPPWLYSTLIPADWAPSLERFLRGRDRDLMHALLEAALANEHIPPFMYPALQTDFETVAEFFQTGPKSTLHLKRRHGLRTANISTQEMNGLIREELKRKAGPRYQDPA